MKKIELLAPAGDLLKLKTAIDYGADAVYVGGEEFSLRTACNNFDHQQLLEGIEYVHERGKRIYVAVNIFPRNDEIPKIKVYAEKLAQAKVDAVIVADIGTFRIMHDAGLPTHVSTQANTVNLASAREWKRLGAARVVLARELGLDEVAEISLACGCETEVFVHGANCVSYSGRCLLSNYLTSRDANHGECTQPCRWKYYLMEETRPGQYFPVVESENGTFIFNSKDLCMIEHIPELVNAGVHSLKIEGRVKSEYYVATIVKAYRKGIDDYYDGKPFNRELFDEVCKVSHREQDTNFYFGKKPLEIYGSSSYIREYDLVGIVKEYRDGHIVVEQRNKIFVGDVIETLEPSSPSRTFEVKWIRNGQGDVVESTPHPTMIYTTPIDFEVGVGTFLRKRRMV